MWVRVSLVRVVFLVGRACGAMFSGVSVWVHSVVRAFVFISSMLCFSYYGCVVVSLVLTSRFDRWVWVWLGDRLVSSFLVCRANRWVVSVLGWVTVLVMVVLKVLLL